MFKFSEEIIWVIVLLLHHGRLFHYRAEVVLTLRLERRSSFATFPGETHLSYFLTCREWVATGLRYVASIELRVKLLFLVAVDVSTCLASRAENIIRCSGSGLSLFCCSTISVIFFVVICLAILISVADETHLVAPFLWICSFSIIDHGTVDVDLFVKWSQALRISVTTDSAVQLANSIFLLYLDLDCLPMTAEGAIENRVTFRCSCFRLDLSRLTFSHVTKLILKYN